MATENNPTQTSFGEFTKARADKLMKEGGSTPKIADTDTATEKLKERRKKFKLKDALPKVEGLDSDQSEDLASAMAVMAGGTGDASSEPASMVSMAKAIKDRKDAKEAKELAEEKAAIQGARDAKIDALLDKQLAEYTKN
jgi:hypothetical protein